MAESILFKDILSPHLIDVMARNIAKVSNRFNAMVFREKSKAGLEALELKDRARHIADAIDLAFNHDYDVAINALIESMKIPINASDNLGKYSSFYYMPYSEFIIKYGINHYDQSMHANYELTKVFSAEFSIRPFIMNHPDKTLKMLHQWVEDKNHHVRRLVSEGTRTRLPWAGRLPMFQQDPKPVLQLLEKLKNDTELYVRRSVANNLNDITKDHPAMVIDTLSKWQAAKDRDENTDWIIKHASRSLIKDGYTQALKLQGFDPDAKIVVEDLDLSKKVLFGKKLDFQFSLRNSDSTEHKLVVDFVIYFKKANGTLAPKVFKLKELNLKPDEVLHLAKSHAIKPITTRTYYNGEHMLAIQVNGSERMKQSFELEGV